MRTKSIFPLSPLMGCLAASAVAAIVGMGGWAAFEGVEDPLTLFLMTLIGGWPIACGLAFFVGTQILPVVTARIGFTWWALAVTGALTGVAPTLGGMLLSAGRAWGDGISPFAAGDWVRPLIVAGLAGAIGGLVFWIVTDDEGRPG